MSSIYDSIPFECPQVLRPQDEVIQRDGLLIRLNSRDWAIGRQELATLARAAREAGWTASSRNCRSCCEGFAFTLALRPPEPPQPPSPVESALQEALTILEEYRVEEEWRSAWSQPPIIRGGARRITRALDRAAELPPEEKRGG